MWEKMRNYGLPRKKKQKREKREKKGREKERKRRIKACSKWVENGPSRSDKTLGQDTGPSH